MSQKKNIIYSGLILAAASAFAKLIGAFLKIPLTAIIGPGGVRYFSAGINLYNVATS